MKSGAPWHIKGVRPEAVDNAREAARRAGMSVGQWLNSKILEASSEDDDDDIYGDAYAPPAMRYAQREQGRGGADIAAIADRLEGLTEKVERLAQVATASRDEAPQYDATARRLSDAIARLDQRVETSILEGRNATEALGVKVESVDRALSALGRERIRASSGDWSASVDQAVDEITQRQRELEREGFASVAPTRAPAAPERDDFAAIHERLRHVSERVDAFSTARMGEAIDGLRSDLTDIASKLTEASPRRAIEALESEVRTLASRLDAGRRAGAQGPDLSSILSGLAEVRDAIRAITPAENLSGAVDAIHVLSNKIDQMAAGAQDPGALHQLEAAIAGLRGIVSRVASDDSLAALTQEVRTLSARIGGGETAAGSSDILRTLEQRIGTIADAIETVRLSASSSGTSALEAAVKSLSEKIERMQAASERSGGADLGAMIGSLGERIEKMHVASDPLAGNSPFGAMLGSLGEKIERLQAARGDGDVLRQIEARIAALSDKLEASEAKLGNLDSIDRGLKELVAYLESVRNNPPPAPAQAPPPQSIVKDVMRTQESLEAAHGTIGDVVDRLAMIETGMRSNAPAQPSISGARPTAQKSVPDRAQTAVAAPAVPSPAATKQPLTPAVPAAAARPGQKIDDILPPDHPLEPGSGKPRPGMAAASAIVPPTVPAPATPAERIAASKVAAEPAKTAVADSDAKLNFIVAARRAAQAAAEDDSTLLPRGTEAGAAKAAAAGGRIGKHVKSIILGASVIAIIVGALHFAASMLNSRDVPSNGPGPQSTLSPVKPPAGSSGVLPVPSAPSATATPNAGVLPPPQPAQGVPPQPAAMPERSETSPPAPPPAPVTEVTGALVTRAPAATTAPAAAPAASVAVPQSGRPAPLPAAIGGKALLTAAESGDPAAAYEIAMRFSEGRGVNINPEAAAAWFERAAKGGLAPALFRLGGMYEKGIGIKKDLNRARELYTAAAEKGNAKAMHNLAVLYADGFDNKPDYPTAIQWFRKAAARGVPDSQYNLGVLYARGIGVDQNFGESFRWFALAAQAGDQDAAQKRDDVAKRLDPQTLSAVRSAVQSWVPEPQPDDAITVKTPPGGWDPGQPAAGAKAKSKRAQTSSPATSL